VPDATGLADIAKELEKTAPDSVIDAAIQRTRATVEVKPEAVRGALTHLTDKGYTFLASLHGVDYYPEEPRLGVIYELLDMKEVDRITLKARLHTEDPHIASIVDLHPGADFPEREVYDMFGVIFDGHPDLRRILMPEDYEGFPQRRDFPVGGEPVLFTYNERDSYGRYQ
jgi:NADH-quinone oxidoreductase subunit C